MAFVIKCKDKDQATSIALVLTATINRSRFILKENIEISMTHKPTIKIHGIRLRQSKPYCGNHAGSCRLERNHRKSSCLEGLDWVSFNNMLNDVLDANNHDGDAGSSVCIIRKAGKRRLNYQANEHGEWEKDTEDFYYANYRGKKAPQTGYTPGTPGILGWRADAMEQTVSDWAANMKECPACGGIGDDNCGTCHNQRMVHE